MNHFRGPRPPPFRDSDNPMTLSGEPVDEPTVTETEPEFFYPELFDVFKVRYLLQWKIVAAGLPAEIVDLILEAAEYWPSVETRMDTPRFIRQDRDQILLETVPLCHDEKILEDASPKILPHRTIHPCRKIIFTIKSHDQGWGGGPRGDTPFHGSYTWFDTEVIHTASRHDSDETGGQQGAEATREGETSHQNSHYLPGPDRIQANKTAVPETQTYHIVWHYLDNIDSRSAEAMEIEHLSSRGRDTLDGRVVRTLEVGDSIAVWGRARFPGWSNHVEYMSVRVFWAV
ncbi:uncharacterized protein ACLA_057750 [Aspergillus clavatus NRRL 1]|uniref:Ankyrin repeat protein n=1 Tax=Aspergillus clavatus (strain ATCC 1007 / CBS 513.65 / DSM 816 / NCTC 3887 / NRRL 1 / QM 1276 / 107) TaxID=344612 RepID=A1C3X9_ASPCL|nr:uncharacterized protein ACLA_057750 [Aspergillus clavatus NRRL 1]EAW15119.1 conserved hypothetical protein [Aspergillus clavatus NRRL 1]